MPPPKKTAKPAASKPDPKHDEGKDLRRAYEHLGRVQVMHDSLGKHTGPVVTLTQIAEQQLAESRPKDAADLLRAAEHLSFAVLASSHAEQGLSPALEKAITEEFDHKLKKAEEHRAKGEQQSDALKTIYEETYRDAQKSYGGKHWRKALELVRAVEALAHVRLEHAKQLASGSNTALITS